MDFKKIAVLYCTCTGCPRQRNSCSKVQVVYYLNISWLLKKLVTCWIFSTFPFLRSMFHPPIVRRTRHGPAKLQTTVWNVSTYSPMLNSALAMRFQIGLIKCLCEVVWSWYTKMYLVAHRIPDSVVLGRTALDLLLSRREIMDSQYWGRSFRTKEFLRHCFLKREDQR